MNLKGNEHKVVIVHGYTASPQQNWFPWLKQELEKLDITVHLPAMPAPMAPQADAWIETLWQEVPEVDEKTHFIGHSLGCIASLLYLHHRHRGQKAGSLILVSPFSETTVTLPELAGFTEPRLPLAFARDITPNRYVITACDDTIVPCEYSRKTAMEMDARLIEQKTGGHFLDREGFTTFPLVLQTLREAIDTASGSSR